MNQRLFRTCSDLNYVSIKGLQRASGKSQRWNNDLNQLTYMSLCAESAILELMHYKIIKNLKKYKATFKTLKSIPSALQNEVINVPFYLMNADVSLQVVTDISTDGNLNAYVSTKHINITMVSEYLDDSFYGSPERDKLVSDLFATTSGFIVQSARSTYCNNLNIVCDSVPAPVFSNFSYELLSGSPTKKGVKVTTLEKGFDLDSIWVDGAGFGRILQVR